MCAMLFISIIRNLPIDAMFREEVRGEGANLNEVSYPYEIKTNGLLMRGQILGLNKLRNFMM